jgi:membrane fusion protein, macrolide-specific efflux system
MARIRGRGWFINLLLAATVLAVAGGIYFSFFRPDTANASVQTATVTRGTVQETVSASGTIASARTVGANFSATGTVSKILVRAGQRVRAGQLLTRLDDSSAREQLAAARVALRSARASLATTEDTLGCSVPSDCSTSKAATLLSAKASEASAKLQVQQDEEAVAATRLTAPIDGTVVSINGFVGQAVAAGGTTDGTSGTDVLVVADLSHLELVGDFSETDVAKLMVGQRATVSLDALPNTTVRATVVRIDRASTVVNNVVTYEVALRLRGRPKGIRLGQSGSATVIVAEARNALTVPSAVVQSAGGQSFVTVLRGDRQVRTPVQVGLEGDQTTEITSGLRQGDRVVIPTTSSSGNGFPSGAFPGGPVVRVGGGPQGGSVGGP